MSTPRRRRNSEPMIDVANTNAVPTHEDIARRAYELYEQRGSEGGHDLGDWFRAERELRLSDTGAADVAA
jgi:hypothetical protein